MAKIYGALEVAQLEWFTDAGKPAPASYIYRVIYVSDLKQVQVSDGTNWIAFLNTSTNQTLAGDITFTGAQIFSGQHRLSVTTNSSTGAIVALAATTPVIEFTGAVTSIAGIASGASGATVMLVNRSGNSFQVLDEGSGASATNRIRTGAGSITLANNASVLLTYVGDNRWHVVGGSGSGAGAGGSKNYFTIASANANFAQNTVSPWSAATLTLSSGVPTGAPTLTATQMAIAATATNPLLTSESLYNMQLTKSAANAQGQGFISSVLTIDREDVAKVLTGTFSYEVVSGTIDLSGASTQSLEIWVYNVTANQWIQPAGFRGMNQSSGVGQVTFTFQTDGTPANVQYRVAVITAQTSASNYVVNFNDFRIGPQTVPIVQLRNPAGTIIATGSLTPPSGYLYCDGTAVSRTDYAELFAAIGTTYGVGNGTTTFNIPDLRGIFARGAGTNPSNASNTTTMGNRQLDALKSHNHTWTGAGRAGVGGDPNYFQYGSAGGANNGNMVASIGNTGDTETRPANVGVAYHICFSSGFVQTSNDTDTRVVSMTAGRAQAAVTAGSNITGFNLFSDTHGAFNASTGIYTIPVTGDYVVSVVSAVPVTGSTTIVTFYDGAQAAATNTGTGGSTRGGSSILLGNLLAGKQIFFRPDTSVTLTNELRISIHRLSGPSVIAASESVNANYFTTSTGAMAVGTPAVVVFGTRSFDSHNAYNSTTGIYTVPVSGKYQVNATITSASTSQTQSLLLDIMKNGSTWNRFQASRLAAVSSALSTINSTIVAVNAGDTIEIRCSMTSGTGNFNGNAYDNNFSIARVGN